MHSNRELQHVMFVIPGCARLSVQYPLQISPYSHEQCDSRRHPCKPTRHQDCYSCKYDRNERAAGLRSAEIAKIMNPQYDFDMKFGNKGSKSSKKASDGYERDRRARGHSPCATCKTHRDFPPASLHSKEIYRCMDVEDQRNFKAKERKSPRGYRSRHKLRYPPNYRHYEGFIDEGNRRAHKNDDEAILVALCIGTGEPKGKICNLQRNQVSIHCPDKSGKRYENRENRMSHPCKSHVHMDKDSLHSHRAGRKSLGPRHYSDQDGMIGVKEVFKHTKYYTLI